MSKQLVLIGGGHAHMVTLANLHQFISRGYGVTVIGPSDHHYYSGMGPGMLSRTYTPDQIRFATRHVVEKQGGRFIKSKATRVDAQMRQVFTEAGGNHPYDVLSINAGSYVPDEVVDNQVARLYTAKPIERLLAAQEELLSLAVAQPLKVAVVGGGAAAVEMAGNAWRLLRDHARHSYEIEVFTSRQILHRFPPKVQRAAKRSFERRGIDVVENTRVKRISQGSIELENGDSHAFDFCFLAAGVRPSSLFKDSMLPMGPDGGLAVNHYLQSIEHPEIFGGGDCIYFQPQPLDKVGVYAVRQNPVLFHNLMATLEGSQLQEFSPGGNYLLIFNMGDGTGVFYKNGILLKNRLAFIIKDYIDRRFMRKFQAYEV